MNSENENKRKSLSSADERAFWIASGGKCAKCKDSLIYVDGWKGKKKRINLGEKAHVIGHGEKGPRRKYMDEFDFTQETIDDLENLLLLCVSCHKIIDDNPDNYSPEYLFKLKEKHEGWVESRLQTNQKTILVIHKRMGPPIDHIRVANELDCVILDCLALQDEFGDFSESGWSNAKSDNEEFFDKVSSSMAEYPGASLSILPLSPIPLLAHFGSLISDTIPATVFQFDRNRGIWVLSAPNLPLEGGEASLQIQSDVKGESKQVVSLSVSATVNEEDIREVICEPFDSLRLSVAQPALDRVLYSEQVEEVKKQFKSTVEQLHDQHRYKELHLFYAGPAGLAIELGRCINKNMWPHVFLYHFRFREEPKYQLAFRV